MSYRAPYDWEFLLAHLRTRAVEGVEQVDDVRYRRIVQLEGQLGTVEVVHQPAQHSLLATVRFPSLRALPQIVARLRRLFDLDADVGTIGAQLAHDPLLAPLIAARPGLRIAGGWDPFEVAVRAILGQQVSVEAARRLAGCLVQLCGVSVPSHDTSASALTLAFPDAAQLLRADLTTLGMTGARRTALQSLARAALADAELFQVAASVEETVARLCAVDGIGEWTAHYIALRALREPDAFPASDVGILRGATPPGGERPRPAALLARAEAWRPWRAYAAQHLWAADTAVQKEKANP